jgi:hypothetical protein
MEERWNFLFLQLIVIANDKQSRNYGSKEEIVYELTGVKAEQSGAGNCKTIFVSLEIRCEVASKGNSLNINEMNFQRVGKYVSSGYTRNDDSSYENV